MVELDRRHWKKLVLICASGVEMVMYVGHREAERARKLLKQENEEITIKGWKHTPIASEEVRVRPQDIVGVEIQEMEEAVFLNLKHRLQKEEEKQC